MHKVCVSFVFVLCDSAPFGGFVVVIARLLQWAGTGAQVVIPVIKQFSDQVIRLACQSFRSNPKFLQKLLKYFDGKIISTFLELALLGMLAVIFVFILHDPESVIWLSIASQRYWNNLSDVLE